MKNADDMLKRIMEEVDQDGDGKIQYNGTQLCLL
jgi:solute carrier family 25 phosphate transporter 23/24/25/41